MLLILLIYRIKNHFSLFNNTLFNMCDYISFENETKVARKAKKSAR
ncbi:hypothetical protein IFVP5_C1240075 [Vibrio parahaemolyticus]|nr:hypothetical protein D046_3101 [Vibrio parahaemolyticus V-223/04]